VDGEQTTGSFWKGLLLGGAAMALLAAALWGALGDTRNEEGSPSSAPPAMAAGSDGGSGTGTGALPEGHPEVGGQSGTAPPGPDPAPLRARVDAAPDDPEARLALVKALVLRAPDEAVAHVDKLLALRPGDAVGRTYQGLIAAARGDTAGGVRQIDAVLASSPDTPDALFFRGMLAMQESDRETLVRHWKRYTEVVPPDDPRLEKVRRSLAMIERARKGD